jgi:putative transposase
MPIIRTDLLDEMLKDVKTQDHLFGPDGVLKQLTKALVERALNAELGFHLEQERQADVETPRTKNRRNGTTPKTLQTEQGPVPLEIPRDRLATFEPQLIQKHQTRIAALDEKVLALYARGMSTRDIQGHLEELYGTELSSSLISHVTDAVSDELTAWQTRPLEARYAVIWLDALVIKVRDQGIVQNKSAFVAIGLTMEGRKEVLGLWLESNEGAKFWLKVITELRSRGVQDVLIACCDGLKGFPQAIEAVFPKTIVQTCIVHQVRNSLAFVNWKDRKGVVHDLKAIYRSASETAARAALEEFEKQWGAKYPTIGPSWRANWERLTPFLSLPLEVRKMVYTTNAIESLNFSLRRVIRNKGHFPNDEAAMKLLYLAIRNAERKWQRPPIEWKRMFAQLTIHFADRLIPST